MILTSFINLWFHTDQWILEAEQDQAKSFIPVFFFTAFLIPLCSLLAEAVINKFNPSIFIMVLSFQFWSLVLYFIVSNLIITSLIFFIGTLIHEKESKAHSAKFFYTAILLSATPIIILPAVALLSRYLGMGPGLFTVLKFVILIWTFIIQISLIRNIFGFTSIKSALLYISSLLCLFAFDFLLVFNTIFNIFSRLS